VGGRDDGGLERQDGWRGLATAQAQQLILDRREATKWASDSPARGRAEIVDDGDAQPELNEAHHELSAVGFDGRRPCLVGGGPGLSKCGSERTTCGRCDQGLVAQIANRYGFLAREGMVLGHDYRRADPSDSPRDDVGWHVVDDRNGQMRFAELDCAKRVFAVAC
jgi:hypothetical protein